MAPRRDSSPQRSFAMTLDLDPRQRAIQTEGIHFSDWGFHHACRACATSQWAVDQI